MLQTILDEIQPHAADLVAVSKTKPKEVIRELYDLGQRAFGENRAQEMQRKWQQLPEDIQWHMIGHIQKNKLKYIIDYVHLIHSIDSVSLLKATNDMAKKKGRKIPVLLQFKIAIEESKYGFKLSDIEDFVREEGFTDLENVHIRGVMGMASFTQDKEQVRYEFRHLKQIFDQLKQWYFKDVGFDIVSMGMSGDYKIALEEGANMLRIGSLLFGKRD